MSIPPPGYEAPQASPPPPLSPQGTPVSDEDAKAHPASRWVDGNVQYRLKSVQVLRGREGRAKAKWHNQGWEFVSEHRGRLRTELNFRRAKPKTLVDHVVSMAAAFRRLQPKTRSVLVACALIAFAGIVGFVVGTQGGGESPTPSSVQTAASTAPQDVGEVDRPAQPRRDAAGSVQPARTTHTTAAPVRAASAGTAAAEQKPPKTKARVVSTTSAQRTPATTTAPKTTDRTSTSPGGTGHVYANCTEASDAGAAPIMRGTPDYNTNRQLDRDDDGIACES